MSGWLLFALLTLGTARLTRFVVKDDMPLVYYPRKWIVHWRNPIPMGYPLPGDHKDVDRRYWNHWWLGELVTCPWCASAYIAAGTVGGVWLAQGLPLPFLWWAAVWGAAGWLAAKS